MRDGLTFNVEVGMPRKWSVGKISGYDFWCAPLKQEIACDSKGNPFVYHVAKDRNDPETYIGHFDTLKEMREFINQVEKEG